MRTVTTLFFVGIVHLSCFAAKPPADNNDVNKIIQAALEPSPPQENLRRLTDEIGGRFPGTPAIERAVQWGMQAFTAAGSDSVHSEGFKLNEKIGPRLARDQIEKTIRDNRQHMFKDFGSWDE